jgi:hypothetical protein
MSWNNRYKNEKTAAGHPSIVQEVINALNPFSHVTWDPGYSESGKQHVVDQINQQYQNIKPDANPSGYGMVTGPSGKTQPDAVSAAEDAYDKHKHFNKAEGIASLGADTALGYGVVKGVQKVKNLLQRNR